MDAEMPLGVDTVMVADPIFLPLTTPPETDATDGSEEDHASSSRFAPSGSTTSRLFKSVLPSTGMLTASPAKCIAVIGPIPTVTVAEAVNPLSSVVTVMTAVPLFNAVTLPD